MREIKKAYHKVFKLLRYTGFSLQPLTIWLNTTCTAADAIVCLASLNRNIGDISSGIAVPSDKSCALSILYDESYYCILVGLRLVAGRRELTSLTANVLDSPRCLLLWWRIS